MAIWIERVRGRMTPGTLADWTEFPGTSGKRTSVKGIRLRQHQVKLCAWYAIRTTWIGQRYTKQAAYSLLGHKTQHCAARKDELGHSWYVKTRLHGKDADIERCTSLLISDIENEM